MICSGIAGLSIAIYKHKKITAPVPNCSGYLLIVMGRTADGGSPLSVYIIA